MEGMILEALAQMTHEERVALFKKLLVKKVARASCWERCDFKNVVRILSLLLK